MKAQELIQECTKLNKTIASCESLTAGLFTSTLASIPGASAVLKGGLVTYFTEMKKELAHVDESIVVEYGVVSKQCADAMAKNTREITGADYCVSFTGNAGPDVMEEKPAGCVYCSIASKETVSSYHFQISDRGRNEIREEIVERMIEQLLVFIQKEEQDNGGYER